MLRGTLSQLITIVLASAALAEAAYGHYYVDFSVDKLWFDHECHLNVAVSNQGEGVPAHFYYSQAPVSLAISKGTESEPPLSLTVNDRQQALAHHGGKVIVRSARAYVNNPKPVAVTFHFGTEYGDYNQRNDQQTQAIDCQLGKGEIAGEPLVYEQPDIAIADITVDAEHCQVKVTLENKTRIALETSAWGKQGVQLVQKNQHEGSILSTTLLAELDPEQTLNQTPEGVTFTLPIPNTQDKQVSIHAWYVTNDNDFHNNARSYTPPSHCRSKP